MLHEEGNDFNGLNLCPVMTHATHTKGAENVPKHKTTIFFQLLQHFSATNILFLCFEGHFGPQKLNIKHLFLFSSRGLDK